MGLHFMDDPLFEIYDLPYSNKFDEKILIEEKKKMCIKCRTQKWLFSSGKDTNQENIKITTYYD